MLRLAAILLMTCALVSSVHAQRRDRMKDARQDVEAARKSSPGQPAALAQPKHSDSTTVTIIRKMKRHEYSVPRSN